jgi:hypothetical protein
MRPGGRGRRGSAHRFYPAGHVDAIADDREFEPPTGPDIIECHFAKMQADAKAQLGEVGGRTPPVPGSECGDST